MGKLYFGVILRKMRFWHFSIPWVIYIYSFKKGALHSLVFRFYCIRCVGNITNKYLKKAWKNVVFMWLSQGMCILYAQFVDNENTSFSLLSSLVNVRMQGW